MRHPVSARRQFVRKAMQAPYLSREEEHALAVRWRDQNDRAALDRLALAHMRLVIALAARFRTFGLSMSDMIQEGHVGLMEAAARFEPEREVRFSTYASWWIRASIQDYVLRNWSIVRGGTSSTQKALFFNLRRLRARLASGSVPLSGQQLYQAIAMSLGVKARDVELMNARLSGPDTSLNAPILDSDGPGSDRQDFLVCDRPLPDQTVGEAIDQERRHHWLIRALKVLSDRELRIIRERRLCEEGATLETLGRKLGISKERVRQIEARALGKLRTALQSDHPEAIAPAT